MNPGSGLFHIPDYLFNILTMTYQSYILSNGLKIIHLPSESPVSYCGFAVNVGSRDESVKEQGLAHFVEHTVFKGTARRRAWHILNRMENVGGELNAYTTKESTFVYSIFMEKDFERAVELLSDLVINSVFPENELRKEREVIIDEIKSYEDSPSELIFDEFENLIFNGHPLGHNILGSKNSLHTFNTESCRSFINRFYTADNMTFFCMTNVDFKRIIRLADKYMNGIASEGVLEKRYKPLEISAVSQTKKKKTHISHVIMGSRSYDMYDKRRYQVFLLNNILGGPGMNSRLNVNLREKRGLVYNVESNVTAYTDTGVFSVYLGVAPENRCLSISLVEKEMAALRNQRLTPLQLAAAKKQAIGQFGVASDNKESRFLNLGKSFLYSDHCDTLPEIFSEIEKITASQILDIANELLQPDRLFMLVYE